jgi:signal transduction histidine kinase
VTGLIAALTGLCAALCIALWVCTMRRGADRAEARELRRVARLAAGDLRGPALGLLGHAAHVPPPLGASLIAVCRDILDVTNALVDLTEAPGAPRPLRLEDVRLGPLLDFVVAQVAGQLGPGQRAWRQDSAAHQVCLRADRRALHQILLRLLTSAALSTGEGDAIGLSVGVAEGHCTIVIEDEGAGLAVARIAGGVAETRGLGVGLVLVRALVAAHGGSLQFESASLVGTRAVLQLPGAVREAS